MDIVMNTRFDVTNNVSRPISETDRTRDASESRVAPSPVSESGKTTRPSDDGVKLLSAEIAELAKTADVIDHSKVERLREAIANGSYQIDADAIASKLVDFESELGGE